MTAQPARHWDRAYRQADTTCSWFEIEPTQSLRMIDAAGISDQSVVDVGGGASRLADALIRRGWSDVTVLDVSGNALQAAKRRLGSAGDQINWIDQDLLTWVPERDYRLWHDRAVFHFFTEAPQRAQYLRALTDATTTGSIAVIGCFALDGPERCSGLPAARYSPAGLAEQLGSNWVLILDDRADHYTPGGDIQPFTWAAFRRDR